MFPAAICKKIFYATGIGQSGICPGRARAQPRRVTSAVPDQLIAACKGNPMNVTAPKLLPTAGAYDAPAGPQFEAAAVTGGGLDEDLMTRRQVASLFGVTSAAVATWARRGRLPEIRNEAGRPRYRRADVAALARRGTGRRYGREGVPGPRPGTGDVAGRRSSP